MSNVIAVELGDEAQLYQFFQNLKGSTHSALDVQNMLRAEGEAFSPPVEGVDLSVGFHGYQGREDDYSLLLCIVPTTGADHRRQVLRVPTAELKKEFANTQEADDALIIQDEEGRPQLVIASQAGEVRIYLGRPDLGKAKVPRKRIGSQEEFVTDMRRLASLLQIALNGIYSQAQSRCPHLKLTLAAPEVSGAGG